MNPENLSLRKEAIISKAPLLRGLLIDPTAESTQSHFQKLFSEVASAGGYQTTGHLMSAYGNSQYLEAVHQGIFPWSQNSQQELHAVVMPLLVGYEVSDKEAIQLFLPEVRIAVIQHTKLPFLTDKSEESFKWFSSLMNQGHEWRKKKEDQQFRNTHIATFIKDLDLTGI